MQNSTNRKKHRRSHSASTLTLSRISLKQLRISSYYEPNLFEASIVELLEVLQSQILQYISNVLYVEIVKISDMNFSEIQLIVNSFQIFVNNIESKNTQK